MAPKIPHAISLAMRYPAYSFTVIQGFGEDGPSYCARAKSLGTRPWCVMTDDPGEFRELLGEPGEPEPLEPDVA